MPEVDYIAYVRVLINKAKFEGHSNDTDDQLFKYLILQLRKNLKIIVFMSPIGDLMHNRTAKSRESSISAQSTIYAHSSVRHVKKWPTISWKR